MPGLYFMFMSVVLFSVGLVAICRPNLSMFSTRSRWGWFRRANRWQYVADDGLERSPAGILLVRAIGGIFIVTSVGMFVSSLKFL